MKPGANTHASGGASLKDGGGKTSTTGSDLSSVKTQPPG
tara:strand:+ start:1166 stop:1282 length:117 start_codon:yes stop_codon:yes gene_type:complete